MINRGTSCFLRKLQASRAAWKKVVLVLSLAILPATPGLAESSASAPSRLTTSLKSPSDPAAAADLEKKVAAAPADADAWFQLAAARYALRNISGAEDALRACIKITSANAPAWNALGVLLAERQKSADAAGAFGKAITADPGYVLAYKNRAVIRLWNLRDPSGATDDGKRALQLASDDVAIYSTLIPALLRSGKKDQAETYLQKILKEYPSDPATLNTVAAYYIETSRWPEAEKAIQDAIAADPSPQNQALHATILIQLQRHDDAIPVLRKLIATDSTNSAARLQLAQVLSRSEADTASVNEAISLLSEAIRLEPGNTDALISLADIHLRQKQPREASDLYKKALDLDRHSFRALLGQGQASEALDDPDAAIAAYEGAVFNQPKLSSAPWSRLSALYTIKGRVGEAERAKVRALALDPALCDSTAVPLHKNLRYRESEKLFRAVIERNPTNPSALTRLAECLLSSRRGQEARNYLEKSLALRPDDPLTLGLLGEACSFMNDFRAAQIAFERSAAIEPIRDIWFGEYVRALFQQNKFAEAEQIIRQNLITSTNPANAWGALDQLQRLQGRSKAQRIAFLEKEYQTSKDATIFHILYTLELEEENYEAAEKFIRKGLAAAPDDAAHYGDLGVALAHQGKRVEAMAAFRKSAELGVKQPFVFLSIANLQAWDGNYADAIATLKTLLEKHPDSREGYLALLDFLQRAGKREESTKLAAELTDKGFEIGRGATIGPDEEARGDAKLPSNRTTKAALKEAGYVDIGKFSPAEQIPLIALEKGNFAEAEAAAQELVEKNPNSSNAWYIHGDVFLDQKKFADAITSFRKAVDIDPKNAVVWRNLQYAYRCVGRYTESLSAARRYRELEPTRYNGLVMFIETNMAQKDYEALEKNAQEGMRLFPKNYEFPLALGHAYRSAGRNADSVQWFQKAQELARDNPEILSQLGLSLFDRNESGDRAESTRIFNLLVEKEPNNLQYLNLLGMSLAFGGSYDEGVKILRKATTTDPSYLQSWANLVSVYFQHGDNDAALRTCEDLAKINPQAAAELRSQLAGAPATPSPDTISESVPVPSAPPSSDFGNTPFQLNPP